MSSTRDNTIAQHVADLHAVRGALALRYPRADRWVLAGHSWGVALTLAYLDQHGEEGLDGLLLTDGFDAYDDNAERSFARLAELASAQAEATRGEESREWREVARFASNQAARGAPYPLDTIVEASGACGTLEWELDRPEPLDPGRAALGAVTSPIVVPDGLLVAWNFETMIPELTTLDLSNSVPERQLPALLVWGGSDCRVPVSTGESLRDRYGGDAELVVVDGATHFAVYSQPEAFGAPARAFLEALP